MENDRMFELMEKMYIEMQDGFKQVNGKIDNLENRMGNLENRMGNLENRMDSLETKVDNNTLLLEKAQADIKLLAEGHENLIMVMEKQNENIMDTIDKNYSLHDRAIKELSKNANKGEEAYTYIQSIKDVFNSKG